ncbi:uncharacterized protein [Diadema antillarum]|uniref:uncharacterized protein n=1 Tax=Diadema antillarum TaxID=105358 RepID=UPI003A8A8B70
MVAIRETMGSFADTFLAETSLDTPIENQWMEIKNKILSVLEKDVPSKMTSCRFSQPWITAELKRLSRKKKRAFWRSRAAGNKNNPDYTTYKGLKKTMQTECRRAHQTYISDLICGEGSNGGKRFWAYIKNKRCDNTGVSPLLKDGILRCDSKTKAAVLNDQFSSVFTKEDMSNIPDLEASPHPTIFNIDIRSAGVEKLLSKINPHKASGPDNLPGQIINHLESNNILSKKQHGFRKHHSCESQLLLTIHDLAKGLDNKQQIDAVLLDFSKAFDKVPHERLLRKLALYGIQGNLLRWIRAFLQDRKQEVVLEGTNSHPATVISGVPQGTVLGPLLFLTYINDLPSFVQSEFRMFADDCLLYRHISSQTDADRLQEDLTNIQGWETKWQMSLNPSKCEVLRVTNKVKNVIHSSYSLHGVKLPVVDNAKYLGVHINSKLSWKTHIDNTCKKANSTRGFLQRNLHGCPKKIKEQAYVTYVRPILEYASTAWDPHCQDQIRKLEMVQRRAARFTLGDFHPRHSVSEMLHSLKWQSLAERRAQLKVIMLFRILHQLIAILPEPPYIYPVTRSSGRRPTQYRQQFCRTSGFQNSFFPSVILFWNQLPTSVTAASSLEQFRRQLVGVTLHQI